ncbi:hypothetical protein CB1_000548003 [Camelus ferus]|nr:hypothetical protein CB1_000548003 [Camelus ferus]
MMEMVCPGYPQPQTCQVERHQCGREETCRGLELRTLADTPRRTDPAFVDLHLLDVDSSGTKTSDAQRLFQMSSVLRGYTLLGWNHEAFRLRRGETGTEESTEKLGDVEFIFLTSSAREKPGTGGTANTGKGLLEIA